MKTTAERHSSLLSLFTYAFCREQLILQGVYSRLFTSLSKSRLLGFDQLLEGWWAIEQELQKEGSTPFASQYFLDALIKDDLCDVFTKATAEQISIIWDFFEKEAKLLTKTDKGIEGLISYEISRFSVEKALLLCARVCFSTNVLRCVEVLLPRLQPKQQEEFLEQSWRKMWPPSDVVCKGVDVANAAHLLRLMSVDKRWHNRMSQILSFIDNELKDEGFHYPCHPHPLEEVVLTLWVKGKREKARELCGLLDPLSLPRLLLSFGLHSPEEDHIRQELAAEVFGLMSNGEELYFDSICELLTLQSDYLDPCIALFWSRCKPDLSPFELIEEHQTVLGNLVDFIPKNQIRKEMEQLLSLLESLPASPKTEELWEDMLELFADVECDDLIPLQRRSQYKNMAEKDVQEEGLDVVEELFLFRKKLCVQRLKTIDEKMHDIDLSPIRLDDSLSIAQHIVASNDPEIIMALENEIQILQTWYSATKIL